MQFAFGIIYNNKRGSDRKSRTPFAIGENDNSFPKYCIQGYVFDVLNQYLVILHKS